MKQRAPTNPTGGMNGTVAGEKRRVRCAIWRTLSPREQAQLVHLLVARVEYDAAGSTIEVAFHPTGIKALTDGASASDHVEDAA